MRNAEALRRGGIFLKNESPRLRASAFVFWALFDGAGGHAGDEPVEGDHGDGADDGGGHEGAPEVDVAADHLHADAGREGAVDGRADEGQRVDVLLERTRRSPPSGS